MDSVVRSFAYCLDYLREQVADVDDVAMVAQPHDIINHPIWVIGHLTCSCQALGGQIGVPPWLPKSWPSRFGTSSIPLPDVTAYESKRESLDILGDAQSRITMAVQQLSPAQINQPLPNQQYAPLLPTTADGVIQMLVAHSANHVGQLNVWRRLMGLPPVSRHFL